MLKEGGKLYARVAEGWVSEQNRNGFYIQSARIRGLGHILDGAVAKEVAPYVFLDQLLGIELAGREERRIRTALKLSNLPRGQTLENFDFSYQPAIERSRIETLATGAWVRGNETVLQQGPQVWERRTWPSASA